MMAAPPVSLAFCTGALTPSDARKRVRIVVRGDGQRTLLEEATCREIVRRCAVIAELVTVRATLIHLGAHRAARAARHEIRFLCQFIAFLAGELGFDVDTRSHLLVPEIERLALAYLDDPTPPALAGSIRSLLYASLPVTQSPRSRRMELVAS
jgi:hypothetical protein